MSELSTILDLLNKLSHIQISIYKFKQEKLGFFSTNFIFNDVQ